MTFNILPLALTMGEPSGIGGEITLKAWSDNHQNLPPFCIIDCPSRLTNIADNFKINTPIKVIQEISDTLKFFNEALPVLPIELKEDSILGSVNPINSSATILSIEKAVKLVEQGHAGGIVTNPINKEALYNIGFNFPGHTEYLAHICNNNIEPVMMLASDKLKVVPLTRHLSLKDAIETITTQSIIDTAIILNRCLKKYFNVGSPRIAITGLNPHAGEGGNMGTEEILTIKPAIEELIKLNILASGPYSADTLFHNKARDKYDAVITMYHDQALIPIKTIDFETAVNTTLGLPFVRTSPDHGTALDIASLGVAEPNSLISALKLAAQMIKSSAVSN